MKLNSVPGWHVADHLTGCHLYFPTDELLQEQKADMDQFLSSISESQPDVTVSSEESMEVPSSEGKPYRPFQVTSLGSRTEPEGKEFMQYVQYEWETKHTRTVAEREWIGLQYALCKFECAVEPWVWNYLFLFPVA